MKPHISGRSAKARRWAGRLARSERRVLVGTVELALEEDDVRRCGELAAAEFYVGLRADCAIESELDTLLESNRRPRDGLAV